jgi:tetratricopeptide (TPR) repeat protein
MAQYPDVEVVSLTRSITEFEGSVVAREEGVKNGADLVFWGWYGETGDTAPVSVHLEVLCELGCAPELGEEVQGDIRVIPISQLQSFSLQTDLSLEMSYLGLFIHALVRLGSNQIDEAITSFTNALDQTNAPVPALDQSRIYTYRAHAYVAKKDFIQALADCTEAIRLDPNYADAYHCRGSIYSLQGALDHALADYDRAIQLQPDDEIAYSNRGSIYYQYENYQMAIDDFSRSIALNPTPIAYHLLGRTYLAKHEYDKAISEFEKAIALKEDYAAAYRSRGEAYSQEGNHYRAERDRTYAEWLDAQDKNKVVTSEDATVDKTDQYIATSTAAINQNPNDADAYFDRAMAYQANGDYDRAIADLDQSIKLNPRAEAYNNRGTAYAEKATSIELY